MNVPKRPAADLAATALYLHGRWAAVARTYSREARFAETPERRTNLRNLARECAADARREYAHFLEWSRA